MYAGTLVAANYSPIYLEKPSSDSTFVLKSIILDQFIINCDPEILLNNQENNLTYLYWAANAIRVSNNYRIVGNSDSNIVMKAGKVIVLKPSTTVLKGNHYLARIEPCEESLCASVTRADIPRGISPNGDEWNETFDLSDLCVVELKIFNRYGLSVYEATNYTNEWHGQSDKGSLPNGTYFYMIRLSTGKSITGWVYLQK